MTAPTLLTKIHPINSDPNVVHRIIGPDSEIETIIVRENGSERVVIQDQHSVHTFMEIEPNDNISAQPLDDKKRMCWATFQHMDHLVLCVLVNPNQVRLWDSGSILGGGEGTAVHLPFEATSIFSAKIGILVQRKLTIDDQDDDDDMFFLSKPANEQMPPLASLFSLTHPLKTLLPVANSNILEQLLFVGTIDQNCQVCVTFNIDLRRHAVWMLHDAPPPPSLPTKTCRLNSTSTSFVVEEDLLREEGSFYEGITTRQEALADALGVGTRPGNSFDLPVGALCGGLTPLHPDFTFTLIYESFPKDESEASDTMAHHIFIADSLLCLQIETQLVLWKIEDGEVRPMRILPCLSAVPIQCFPGCEIDILVANRGVGLYRRGEFLSQLAFDDVNMICDSEKDRFTMELASGELARVELNFTLTPLVERVLATIHAAVGEQLAIYIRMDCVRLIHCLRKSISEDPSWTVMCFLLNRILGLVNEKSTSLATSNWNMLLESDYHTLHSEEFAGLENLCMQSKDTCDSELNGKPTQTDEHLASLSEIHQVRVRIFDALHLLYEDLKLSMITRPWCQKLRSILMRCRSDTMLDFINHYVRDSGSALETPAQGTERSMRLSSFSKPPCIMSWILNSLKGQVEGQGWIFSPVVPFACRRIHIVQKTYTILVSEIGKVDFHRDILVVKALLEAGIQDALTLQEDFPLGVALPLLEVLARCRTNPRVIELEDLPGKAWTFIGRPDMHQKNLETTDVERLQTYEIVGDLDQDGLEGIEIEHALRFPSDNRLKEVARLLRSSKASYLKVPRAVELSDHDYEKLKQERLLTLCRRVLALPLGRGMLTLGTFRPVPAEQLPIPDLCLSGRIPPTNSSLALDTTNTPADMMMWPEFHNGVAAGLRLPPASMPDNAYKISRSWIIYNRAVPLNSETVESNSQLTHAHGGLLMALGLRGHLSALSMTDIYEYLTQGSVTTSVGVLLGMAANKRGTCDQSVSKMLCLHIPSLLPPSFSSIDVSAPAHAAAVSGIGLLYQGSSHRLMTEFLLNEMGRRPVHDSSTVDREAYTLSCGISLGMINLAKGGNNAGLADLEIEQRLHRYIVGGIDDRAKRRGQDTADRRLNGGGGGGESERCARVYEGDSINNDVSAPGALLAVGLMYLKTMNKTIAGSISLPNTHFLLEYARPDTLMLRVLVRSLILWDDVEPTQKWIEDQIPHVIRREYRRMETQITNATQAALGFFDSDVEDRSKSGAQGAGATNNQDFGVGSVGDLTGDSGFDRQTVRQMRAYIVTGCCFSLGLRYAGTGDGRAASAITEILIEMKDFRDSNEPIHAALRPEQSIVGMCLGSCAVSLALVMAGTGDLGTLRLLRLIRWRADDGIRHGDHMTIGAAIGLLFLGCGTCTVGRSAEDIAALVAAFYPRFPMNTTDNKYHLQALRHLYALAVQRQYVQAVDITSGDAVSVFVQGRFEESRAESIGFRTPNLLHNTDDPVYKLVVQSDIYYPSSLLVTNSSWNGGYTLFVKKRDFMETKRSGDCRILSAPMTSGNHLGSLFYPKASKMECVCADNTKRFCTDNIFGCVSLSTSSAFIYNLASLASANSKRVFSLIWDAMILQCYYELVEVESSPSSILGIEGAAMIIEKVKRLLDTNTFHIFSSTRSGDSMDTSF